MTASDITIADFQDLLDRLGPHPKDWPAEQRAQAEHLLAASPQARLLLAEAAALHAALKSPTDAPAGLAGRIFDAALKADKDRR